jgi:hypothetical protein
MKSAIGAWKRALAAVGYSEGEIFVNENRFPVYDGERCHVGPERPAIVDEVHRCRNRKTKNARLLGRIAASVGYVLLLSATGFESPDKVGPLVSALGLCEAGYIGERRWMLAHGCYFSGSGCGCRLVFCGRREYLEKMHHEIFPGCGIRLRIKDIPGFPECRYIVDPITVCDCERKRAADALNNVRSLREQLAGSDGAVRGRTLAAMQLERAIVERAKLPVIRELIDDLIGEGRSVAVFVNFRASMEELKEIYGDRGVYVYGEQGVGERERAMELFQSDRVHLIVLNSEAGGASISLHDVRGERPRYSIISPSWSATTFKQVLGRIHRVGGRSPAVQRIMLVDGTIESEIAGRLRRKLANIKHINDATLADDDLI